MKIVLSIAVIILFLIPALTYSQNPRMTINKNVFETRPIVDCAQKERLKMGLVGTTGVYCVDETIILSTQDILTVYVSVDSSKNQTHYLVQARLNKDGNDKFAAYTGNHIKQRIGYIVDHKLLSAPMILNKINNAPIMISIHESRIDADNVMKTIAAELDKRLPN